MGSSAANVRDLSVFRYFGNIFNLSANSNLDSCVNLETIMFPEGATYIGSLPYAGSTISSPKLGNVNLVIFPSTFSGNRDQLFRYTNPVINTVYIFLGNHCKPYAPTNLSANNKNSVWYIKDKYYEEFYEHYNHSAKIKPLSQWEGELPLSYYIEGL